jgi:hypothetical protein
MQQQHLRTILRLLGLGGLAVGVVAVGHAVGAGTAASRSPARAPGAPRGAAAAPAGPRDTTPWLGNYPAVHVCSGTSRAPGTLAGTYPAVEIHGVCAVNGGRALIRGDLTVDSGGALLAIFALNDHSGHGHSGLTVQGDLIVQRGATLALGCEAKTVPVFGRADAVFPCADDPHHERPALSSHDVVRGRIVAHNSLGVLVHNSTITAGVIQTGGGGGDNCHAKGIFSRFQSPVYSDYEDNRIGGSLTVTGLRSCWFGALRNQVHGSLIATGDVMANQAAMEVATNAVRSDLTCRGDRPAVQFGNGDGHPNLVGRQAGGQCAFGVVLRSPTPQAHLSVPVARQHIAVRGPARSRPGPARSHPRPARSRPGPARTLPVLGQIRPVSAR